MAQQDESKFSVDRRGTSVLVPIGIGAVFADSPDAHPKQSRGYRSAPRQRRKRDHVLWSPLMKQFSRPAVIVCLGSATLIGSVMAGLAQTSPTPGPTMPTPPNQPLAKPGTDLVINPTTEECQKGWDPSVKWTKEQFAEFCAKLKAAK
jgi:hypothetical protein